MEQLSVLLDTPVFIWLALMVVFIIIEIITVGLTSIWFAGGALAALLSGLFGMPAAGQAVLFFIVSFGLVFLTRPFVLKYVKPHNIKTNYEDIIGRDVRVTARIDNRAQTGAAVCGGLEWTARSTDDNVAIEAGETASVAAIKGVTLLVARKDQDVFTKSSI